MSSRMVPNNGVSMRPGAITFTVYPQVAEITRATNVIAPTPAFEAEYAACPTWPSKAARDDVLTATPADSSPGAHGGTAAAN